MRIKEITVALGKTFPIPGKQYAVDKPMFSMTIELGEGDVVEDIYAHGLAILEGQADRYQLSMTPDEPETELPPPPPAPAPPPAPSQPRSSSAANSNALGIISVQFKNGTGKNGPWTLYTINFSDGSKVTTFDKAIAIKASDASKKGLLVQAKMSMDGKYKNLESLDVIGEPDITGGGENVPF